MQKVFCLCFTLLLISYALAQDSTQGFPSLKARSTVAETQETNNFVLYGLVARRCRRYMSPPEVSLCQQSVAEMITILDTDIIFPENQLEHSLTIAGPGTFLFVAFKNDLINLLSSPATTPYLKKINTDLNKYLTRERTSFSLWSSTLAFYRTEEMAAKIIATLFQDTSSSMLHLNYLDRIQAQGKENFKQNKELLRTTIESLIAVLDYNQEGYMTLLYPSGVNESLNKSLYHFYVPYYLSIMLLKSSANKQMAYVAPMLMTLTYEFVTAAPDYRYVLKDPEILDPIQFSWKIRDIMAGHLGASRGSLKKRPKTLKFLLDEFSKSTAETVKSLLSVR